MAIIFSLAIDVSGILIPTITSAYYVGDFTVFWAAAQVTQDLAYNVAAITEIQAPITGATGVRPFVYPPSFLAIIEPLGWFPIAPSFIVWSVMSLGIFWWANQKIFPRSILVLSMLSPAIVVCLTTGQSTLIVGGMLVAGLAILPKRPIAAGILLGLAATLKPQLVILAPLALVAAGQWRALATSILTGATIGLTCVAIQGLQIWLSWLVSLSEFLPITKQIGLTQRGFTPTALSACLNLPHFYSIVLQSVSILIAIFLVFMTFRKKSSAPLQVVSVVIGGLLCSPYAMNYDLATMQPALAAMLLNRDAQPMLWLAAAFCFTTIGGPVAILLMTTVIMYIVVTSQESAHEKVGLS